MSDRQHRLAAGGLAYVSFTLFCWSSVPLFLKYFSKLTDGWATNGWRYGMSALFWIPVLVIVGLKGKLPRGLWRAALVPAAFNTAGQICFAWAPYYLNPGFLTFFLRMQIIFIAIGTYLIFPNERALLRSRVYWSGLIVVFAGAAGIGLLNPNVTEGNTLFGIGLALIAGAGFSGYSLGVKYHMQGVHPVFAFAAISNLTAAVLVTLMLIFSPTRGANVLEFSSFQLGMLILSAMLGIAISHVLYYAALNRLGVAVTAGVILLQPVIVSTAAYFLFDERLSRGQWACGIAAMGGAGIMLYAQQRLQSAPPNVVSSNQPALAERQYAS